MVICKVWDAEYPWDVRAEKISFALTRAGHPVHLLARNRDARPIFEQLPEATVHRLAPLPFGGRQLNAVSMFPAFFNPRWLRLMSRTVRRARAEVLLCRDLPLSPAALAVARRHGIPMVFDMAENYPAMIRSCWAAGQTRPLDWLVRNPAAVARVERWVILRADHILVVVDESRERLVSLGVPAHRITVVSNTPPRERLEEFPASRHDPAEGELRVVYLGLLDAESRGVGLLLSALARCRERGLRVRATVFGDGSQRAPLMAQAEALRLGEAVQFTGRVANRDALRALADHHVGIVPHYADEHCSTTIPNKLFDYMAAGLACIVSDAPPLARVVRQAGCGEVFRDRDAVDLARVLESMGDAMRRARFGEAGRAAIASRFHWEADAVRLVGVFESLTTGRQHAPDARAAGHADG